MNINNIHYTTQNEPKWPFSIFYSSFYDNMAYKNFFWSENFSYCSGIIKTLNLFDNSIRSIRNVINKNRKIQHSKSLNQTKAFIKPLFSFMTPKNSIKGKSKYLISNNNTLSASLYSIFLSQKFREIAHVG